MACMSLNSIGTRGLRTLHNLHLSSKPFLPSNCSIFGTSSSFIAGASISTKNRHIPWELRHFSGSAASLSTPFQFHSVSVKAEQSDVASGNQNPNFSNGIYYCGFVIKDIIPIKRVYAFCELVVLWVLFFPFYWVIMWFCQNLSFSFDAVFETCLRLIVVRFIYFCFLFFWVESRKYFLSKLTVSLLL